MQVAQKSVVLRQRVIIGLHVSAPRAPRAWSQQQTHSVISPWSRLLASGISGGRGVWALLDAVQGKKMIGKDRHGNTYWEVSNPGRKPDPIREIDYAEKQMEEIEWHNVPPEWRLWVRYARNVPPTEEEILKGEAQRAYTLARAQEIEEEDQRQRSLEIATGVHRGTPGDQGQDARIAYLADRVHGRSASAPPPGQDPPRQTGEATGQGDTFKPGSWDPNS